MTPEELAHRAARGAPELTDEQIARIAEVLRPSPAAAARRRAHEVKQGRRWSSALDRICGFEPPAPDPALDRYRDGALDWEQRETLGRIA
jgi:hypothetical protein